MCVCFFFFFLAAPQHMEFLGQGSDPSCSFNLCCNAGSLSHCVEWRGVEPVSWYCRDAADPIMPQWELQDGDSQAERGQRCLVPTLGVPFPCPQCLPEGGTWLAGFSGRGQREEGRGVGRHPLVSCVKFQPSSRGHLSHI